MNKHIWFRRISFGLLPILFYSPFLVSQNISISADTLAAHPSALIDIHSDHQGLSAPHVALDSISSPSPVISPANALLIYNTSTAGIGKEAVFPGYYYWDSDALKWLPLKSTLPSAPNAFRLLRGCSTVNIDGYQSVFPEDYNLTDNFGASMVIKDNLAVAGAPNDDVFGNVDQGSAYIFSFNGYDWVQQQKITASDGSPFDYFGWSVNLYDDLIIIGALFDSVAGIRTGSAYVFGYDGTQWIQQQKLIADDGGPGDKFGMSVSIFHDYAVISAPEDDIFVDPLDPDPLVNQGSAYVFHFDGSSWSQQQKLVAQDGGAYDLFGAKLSLYGSDLMIGARGHQINGCPRGAVYVYREIASTWIQTESLAAGDNDCYSTFGSSLDLFGDYAIVGRPNQIPNTAFVYHKIENQWVEQQQFVVDSSATNTGHSVSISDRYALMAAYWEPFIFANVNNYWLPLHSPPTSDAPSDPQVTGLDECRFVYRESSVEGGIRFGHISGFDVWDGCAYPNITNFDPVAASDGVTDDLFGHAVCLSGQKAMIAAPWSGPPALRGAVYYNAFDGNKWTEQQKITASDSAAGDLFGSSISIFGDKAFIGAISADIGPTLNQGAVYVFHFDGVNWMQQQKLVASDGAANDFFGRSVSIDGNYAIIGSARDDVGSNVDQGSAYIFFYNGTQWVEQQKIVASDGGPGDEYGTCVSISGLWVLIGSYKSDSPQVDRGATYAYRYNGTLWTGQQKLLPLTSTAGDYVGYSVSLNGDNAIVGAYLDDESGVDQGSAYLYKFVDTSWVEQQKLLANDGLAEDWFGRSVALSEGYAIIGAQGDDDPESNRGSAYIFQNIGGVWMQYQKVRSPVGTQNDDMGSACAMDQDRFLIGSKGTGSGRGIALFGKIK